jgi:hypothetical protein
MEAIYTDACMKCPAAVSDSRDLRYIRSRVKDEGLSFLTITLPNFARDFEQALEQGQVDRSHFRNFRKCGAIPAFLQGMLHRIFDRDTGRILNDTETADNTMAVPVIIEGIRQICYVFKKLELDCAPERVRASLLNFKEVERSFNSFELSAKSFSEFAMVSSCLWDNTILSLDITSATPRHGPGATSERANGNQKYDWRYWHSRLEPYSPFFGNAVTLGAAGDWEGFEAVEFLEEERELPVRVTPVPKTLKGPRIIAVEPACMQFVQQGLRDLIYDALEKGWYTRGHINFRDQGINQRLALSASRSQRFATIDLSDASDRVPKDLALMMFSANEDFMLAVDACRSRMAVMPDGETIGPLQKFASMGSALCFPVEAMYFYTVITLALLRVHDLPVTPSNCFTVTRDVYVYGDDIIVPSAYAGAVIETLQEYNCKVNSSKTFFKGKFRESCGVDAYDGEEVTPTYIRQPFDGRFQDKMLISWVKSANLFYMKGYWRAASLMFNTCERALGPLPYVSENASCLGRVSFLGYRSISRWNVKHHSFEVKGWCPEPVRRTDALDGYPALSKCLLMISSRTPGDVVDERHLESSALHGVVALKRRWVPAHIG